MKDKLAFSKVYDCIDSECKFIIDSAISTIERDTKEMPLTRKRIEIKDFQAIGENEIEGWISTRDLDWSKDIMIPEGVILSVYQKNPSIFFNHDSTKIIGKCVSLVVSEYGVKARIQFADTFEAYDCMKLAKGGFLNTFSVGFIPVDFVTSKERKFKSEEDLIKQKYTEYKGGAERIIKSWVLLEASLVGTPDNPNAVITQKQIQDMEIKSSTLEMLNLKCADCEKAKEEFKQAIIEQKEAINEETKDITEDSTSIDTKEDIVNVEVVKESIEYAHTEPIELIEHKQIDRTIKIVKSAKQKQEEALIEERKAMLQMELKEMEKEFTKRGKLLRY